MRGGNSEGTGSELKVVDQDIPAIEPEYGPLLTWTPQPGRPGAALYPLPGSGYLLRTGRAGWFRIDLQGRSIGISAGADPIRREASLWGIPIALCAVDRGDISLHAAAVEIDGSALLLAAPGTSGKTTLAGAFHQAGYRILCEDISCCRPASVPLVFPGPALLRLRHEAFARMAYQQAEVVGKDPDRVYLALEDSRRGDARPVPLAGIVFLRPGDDTPTIERVPIPEGIRDLWTLTLKLPDDENRTRCFKSIAALTSNVAVWNLYRRLDFGSLPRVVDKVVTTCRGL